MNKLMAIVCLLTFLPLSGGARAQEAARSGPKAPKVILIIGDGMDQHQITIARDYLAGYRGRLTLDNLPVRSNVQIQTVAEENPSVMGGSGHGQNAMRPLPSTSTPRGPRRRLMRSLVRR